MRTVTTWSDLLRPGNASSFFDRIPLPMFDPATSAYSAANAWWLAELSRLIYRRDVEEDNLPLQPRRSAFLAKVGLRQRAFFSSSSTGTQGFLVESVRAPLFAALVFRGTEQELRDFQSDLAAVTIALESDSIRVHDGFLTALNSVWDDQVAPQLQGISVPIFYAGHSLGAALATLAALRHPPTAVYTFGSPLVGNDAFVASLKGTKIHRIVDGADLVTMVPPETLGYRHAGEPHHLRDSLVSGFKFDPLAWFRPPKSLADHAPINYVERIDSAT